MILSISKNNHDASFCILKEGKILSYSQEERINRKKHSSIIDKVLLDYIKSTLVDNNIKKLDNLILSNCLFDTSHPYNLLKLQQFFLPITITTGDTINYNHHLNHAACGFYFSNFNEAICLVIDGWGSKVAIDNFRGFETTSIYEVSYPANFKTLYKKINYDAQRYIVNNHDFIKSCVDYDLDLTHRLDIGVMYGTVSRHLSFTALDAGKTMGLASYGKPNSEIPPMFINDKYCNMNVFKSDRTLDDEAFPILKNMSFNLKKDLAFSIQKATEDYFIRCVEYIKNKSKIKNLVISGGCALNILANQKIKEKFPEYNIFVDPIPSDAGQSIGAAKYKFFEKSLQNTPIKESSIYLNKAYDKDNIMRYFEKK